MSDSADFGAGFGGVGVHGAATGVAFWKNASIAGGPAPVRAYIEELLPDVLEGRIEPTEQRRRDAGARLGVFQSPPEETLSAVETALADGYRLIDTAAAYGNEREVGEGIRRSGVGRGGVFVTTKLWISDYGHEPALRGIDGSPDGTAGFLTVTVKDPDGRDIELVQWPPGHAAGLSAEDWK